jgi:hypothetical protein
VKKALVVELDERKKDLGDVIAIARSQARKMFRTNGSVRVLRIDYDARGFYVVVVELLRNGSGVVATPLGCKRQSAETSE